MRKYLIDDSYIRTCFRTINDEMDNLVSLLASNELNEAALELSRASSHIDISQRNFEEEIRI